MNIFDSISHGLLPNVEHILANHPDAIHETRRITIGEKDLVITPLFLAALGGHHHLVKFLLERGAACQVENGQDLFYWTLLCPMKNRRLQIIQNIFNAHVISQINGLTRDHLEVAKGEVDPQRIQTLFETLAKSSYWLSRSTFLFLSGFFPNPDYTYPYKISPYEISLELKQTYDALSQSGFLRFFIGGQRDPAFVAAQYGMKEELEGLIANGSYSLERGGGGALAQIAAQRGQLHILEFLKDKMDLRSIPALTYLAVYDGQVEVLEWLHQLGGIDLFAPVPPGPPEAGHTGAFTAALRGKLGALKLLHRLGADLSQPLQTGRDEGCTLAYIAAQNGHLEILEMLHEEGVDLLGPLQTGIMKGYAPINAAALNVGHEKVIRFLMQLGADPYRCFFAPNGQVSSLFRRTKFLEVLGIDIYNYQKLLDYINNSFRVAYDPDKTKIEAPSAATLLPDDTVNQEVALQSMVFFLKCFALDFEAVKAQLESGISPKKLIRSNMAYQFLLLRSSSRAGPLSASEQKQVEILKLLIEHGFDRGGILREVTQTRSRLYEKLLTKEELILEGVLSTQSQLLKDVLQQKVRIPEGTTLIWEQGDEAISVAPHEVVYFLKEKIEVLLSKRNQSSKIFDKIRDDLESLLYEVAPTLDEEVRISTDEEVDQLISLLQNIEEASHLLTKKMVGDESQFAALKAPKIRRKRKEQPQIGARVKRTKISDYLS